ncbi:MAG: hypothetical protein HN890_03840 [Polaribacter sp.]|jgi:hypothetical protein|nr:hypothetical protein [Polaribacter sp.]MBT7135329.1 hypothetical protein [Polaribacter sp.]
MELANIEKLVIKYKNGTTSLEEESILRNYFTGESVAAHLQEYVPMFTYFTFIKKESFDKNVQLKIEKPSNKNRKFLSVAASIVLLLTSVFFIKKENDRYQAKKQFTQITKGLKLLSIQLKKGETALANVYSNQNN